MNNQPRQKLCELIAIHGQSLHGDAKRCEGLLRDFCSEHKREIHVLISAIREQVPADLLSSQSSVPYGVLLARLTKRLHDNLGLADDIAHWTVETWALALGVISKPTTEPTAMPSLGAAVEEVIMKAERITLLVSILPALLVSKGFFMDILGFPSWFLFFLSIIGLAILAYHSTFSTIIRDTIEGALKRDETMLKRVGAFSLIFS